MVLKYFINLNTYRINHRNSIYINIGGVMNKIEIFNTTEEDIKELETVEKVLYSAIER